MEREASHPSEARSSGMETMKNFISIVAALVVTAFAATASLAGGHGSIVDKAKEAGSFSTLLAAAEAAGLAETLNNGEGPFTVFAPTDDAFKKLPEGTVEDLLKPENKEKLAGILSYHVVPGKVMSADLAGKTTNAKTVEGSEVTVDATGDKVMVDGATVTQADIEASNGIIHVIDTVIMPKS